jgi:HSP20 family protein
MTDFGKTSGLFGSADRLREELERVVERLRDGGGKALDAFGIRTGDWHPEIDLVETPDAVLVTLDVPGVASDSLDVQIVGNMLTISGNRPVAETAPGHIVHTQNRPRGTFSHSVPMPVPVNHEEVSAESTTASSA